MCIASNRKETVEPAFNSKQINCGYSLHSHQMVPFSLTLLLVQFCRLSLLHKPNFDKMNDINLPFGNQ